MSEVMTEGGLIVAEQPRRHIPADLAAQANATPMSMLQIAVQRGMDPATIKELMDLQERYQAAEAKRAFVEAMAAFKLHPPRVTKDRDNKQYGSKYTSIGNMVNTVNAGLSPHGLSANWKIEQADRITVTCTLTHRLGHSESTSMSGAPDTSGQKNALQQIKSTVTYLKIATYEAIVGIASSDGNVDDDGRGSGLPEPDAEGKAKLEACGTLNALKAAWEALTKEQRKTLAAVKSECQSRIQDADRAAAA